MEIEESHGISEKFAKAVYHNRWTVLKFWGFLFVLSTPLAVILITQRCIGMSTKPVKGSESDIAFQSLQHHFRELTYVRTEKVEVRCVQACDNSTWHPRANKYVDMLTAKVNEFDQAHPGSIIQSFSYFDMHMAENYAMEKFKMKDMFLSNDEKAVLFMWIWSVPEELQYYAEHFTQELGDWIDSDINSQEADQQVGRLEVSLTGLVTLDRQLFVAIVTFFLGDLMHSWTNVLVLWFALKDPKLTFLALLPMLIEIAFGYALVYFVSLGMDVTYTSSIMCLQMITALGWDYSLFTLTRYTSERRNGLSVEQALVTSLSHSAPLIFISALVLTISWSALMFMPEMFQAFALCAIMGVVTAALANATLLPALLGVLPFLGPPAGTPVAAQGGSGTDAVIENAKQFMCGFYYNVAKWLTKWPFNILLLLGVYGSLMPLTLRCFENVSISGLNLGHSYALTLPRGRKEWSTAMRIQEHFHPMFGVLMPTTIFATNDEMEVVAHEEKKERKGLMGWFHRRKEEAEQKLLKSSLASNPHFFPANCHMMNELVDRTKGKPYAIDSHSLFSASIPTADESGRITCLTYNELDAMVEGKAGMLAGRLWFLKSAKEKLVFMWKMMVKDNAFLSVVSPSIDPMGPDAFGLMDDMRGILKELDKKDQKHIPGIKRMMFGAATFYHDNILYSERALPKVFLGCSLLCFLLVAINFKAVFIPAKLLLTVVWPITWFFGLALMVYQDGILKDLGIQGLSPTGDDGLDWTVPMFSVTFMIGVALDYDYFLFERIYEFREQGFGDRESIQLGLAAQAVTITCGGLILSFTFYTMITESAIPITNQLGFMYFVGILIDTFLVRTIITPALLSIGSWINYWPIVMSAPRYEWLEAGLDPLTDDIGERLVSEEASESKRLLAAE